MRHALLGLLIAIIPPSGLAGAIAQKYGMGINSTSWGDSVSEVVAKHPGGEHYFATGGAAHREYSVPDDVPLFGISRTNMRDYYFFDETDGVESVALSFPYEERQALLQILILSFGPVRRMQTQGIETDYWWTSDDGTNIGLRQTSSKANGILAFVVMGPNSLLFKKAAECAPRSPSNLQKK